MSAEPTIAVLLLPGFFASIPSAFGSPAAESATDEANGDARASSRPVGEAMVPAWTQP